MAKDKFKTAWAKGDRTKLATAIGVQASVICDIIKGRRAVSPARAIELEKACAELGYNIPRTAWVFVEERDPRLFPKQ